MKRFLIPAVAGLLLAIGFASAPTTAQAGTITLIDADFLQPGGQGAGDHTHATNNAPHGFSGFHKFGSYNDTFVDTYKFTIANITQLVFDVTTTNHVINLNFKIYGDHGNKLFSQSGFKTQFGDSNTATLAFTDILLQAMLSQHFLVLKITGTMCSCASYSVVAGTPIPPALLLFLTAIMGVGGIGVVRRRSAVAGQIAA